MYYVNILNFKEMKKSEWEINFQAWRLFQINKYPRNIKVWCYGQSV